MKTECVFDYGLETEKAMVPTMFFLVKGVPCQYSFIKEDGSYLTQLGRIKECTIKSLAGLIYCEVTVRKSNKEHMTKVLKKWFEDNCSLRKDISVLFKIELEDESIFFDGVGITQDNCEPVKFNDTGLSIRNSNFKVLDL